MPTQGTAEELSGKEEDGGQKAVTMPIAGDTPFADINITAYLRQLQGDITSSQTPYIYPKVLSYIDLKNAQRWRGVYGGKASGELTTTVSSFWVAPKHGKKAWLGFAMMPPSGFLVASDKENPLAHMWHAVAFGIIAREEGGKALLIYDYDTKEFLDKEPQRVREVLAKSTLTKLYSTLCDGRANVEVWINQRRREEPDEGHQIESSFQKLTEWASHGDQLFTGAQDPRVSDKYYCITAP